MADSLKRIIRDRYLTPDEAAKYRLIRGQIAIELPTLIQEHHERMAQQSQDLIISKDGTVRGINSPLVAKIADSLGTSEIMRASHVDPTNELSDAALAWLIANRPDAIREVPTVGYLNDTPRAAMIRQLVPTWWADMLPVGGPVLGQFLSYDAARDAEIVWLREHNIPVCTTCAKPPTE